MNNYEKEDLLQSNFLKQFKSGEEFQNFISEFVRFLISILCNLKGQD